MVFTVEPLVVGLPTDVEGFAVETVVHGMVWLILTTFFASDEVFLSAVPFRPTYFYTAGHPVDDPWCLHFSMEAEA